MYHVLSRATAALAYVELGMSFCRKHGIHTGRRPSTMASHDWLAARRAWRCMLFIGTWISATIGYVSGNDWDLPDGSNCAVHEDSIDSGPEDLVQIQMVRIAVLKRNILQLNIALPNIAVHTVHTIAYDLQKWHQDLPLCMQLSHLNESTNPAYNEELRYTILLCHCLYLGAITLFYRRTASLLARLEPDRVPAISQAFDMEKLAHDSVVAARQTASILGLLLSQGGIFERCWIVLFQSHVAATILMHEVARNNLREQASSTTIHDDTLHRIDTCMKVVAICAKVDSVARMFKHKLQPYYAKISAVYHDPVSAAQTGLDWKQLESELSYLVLMPFDNVSNLQANGSMTPDCGPYLPEHPLRKSGGTRWRTSHEFHGTPELPLSVSNENAILPPSGNETSRLMHSPSVLTQSDAALAPLLTQQKKKGERTGSPAFTCMVEELQPGQTLPEFSSCGWS
ncbi:hypothetical protein D6D24_07307 [Aureobasidium pullulans]|uniref:Transcription factor domain-containing protein n=1 Tax=Aureobasidium pullulans TaxID=5580 RepID=A0A4S9JLF7_AURPU|nr:hypothetical protein D6D24_07307 [Aureobasidium pullulans]THY02239.1 hypothetical protein D6D03_05240 [Aureobasidium pullulans]